MLEVSACPSTSPPPFSPTCFWSVHRSNAPACGRFFPSGFCPTIPGEVTSFKLSQDGKTALVNRHPHEIQLWSFAQPDPKLVRRLYGHFQSQFYVRSCFAGPEDNIVISGSEGAILTPFSLLRGTRSTADRGTSCDGSVDRLEGLRLAPTLWRAARDPPRTRARSGQRCRLATRRPRG